MIQPPALLGYAVKMVMMPPASSSSLLLTFAFTTLSTLVHGLHYDAAFVKYNINTNVTAKSPLDFWGDRGEDFTYTPSPDNWRFPVYTLFLDRFVNGDPSNDNANNTVFEHDPNSNQLRHGGDLTGLVDSLDYIHGMGIKAIYIAGSPFINMPWGADAYSPLDLTLLDAHLGTLVEWQNAIDEIHSRGMYIIMDHTMATMGDLIGFDDYLNSSTPFDPKEHKAVWKSERRYHDFNIGDDYNETCITWPALWDESGYPVSYEVTGQLSGCYNSEFDQFGDIEAFGVHPDWQRQLAKFASVQDRLREWVPSVQQKIQHFTCMMIATFDIDGFRIDKGLQVTVDAQATWSAAVRECAATYNKTNFFIPGEITSGNTLGSVYLGRGRRPDQLPANAEAALALKPKEGNQNFFIRKDGENALDGAAFHYSIYRFMTRFLGMSGNLEAGFDLPLDWVESWNQMVITNDMFNAYNGTFDPRHMYGATNQDVFRWPAIRQGVERQLLAYFIITFLLPGIPMVYYGEEQAFYTLDGTADNYVYGRQGMSPAPAWQTMGCFTGNSLLYVDWPIEKGRTACQDDSVSWDHRNPAHPVRNIIRRMFQVRAALPAVNDGFEVVQLGNSTQPRLLNGSTSSTEFGIWSVARSMYAPLQNSTATPVWLVYHNENETTSYTMDCSHNASAFAAPFDAGTKVRNLFAPYDTITLKASAKDTGFGAKPGCWDNFTMAPFEYRLYVPDTEYVDDTPVVTKFVPGHDFPILSSDVKDGVYRIELHFSQEMDCDSITTGLKVSSIVEGSNATATIDTASAKCQTVENQDQESYAGAIASQFVWTANLVDLSDGVHSITVDKNTTTKTGTAATGSTDKFLFRVGQPDNPVVFPRTANYTRTSLERDSAGSLWFQHRAPGASKWRYSSNWGSSWTDWTTYQGGRRSIGLLPWSGAAAQAWESDHVIVQYWSSALGSSSFTIHADPPDVALDRRFPHMFLQGPFNKWGYDSGVANQMRQTDHNKWELHYMDEWPTTFQFNVWGTNPDNQPDQTMVYGEITGNHIFNRVSPNRVQDNVFNITEPPAKPALALRLILDDKTGQLELRPVGNMWVQIFLFFMLGLMPILTAVIATWVFFHSFYQVKVNKRGFTSGFWAWVPAFLKGPKTHGFVEMDSVHNSPVQAVAAIAPRRTVLMATMEYNIDDWDISIKIGGLGVMAKLMSTALTHMDLVWVVPCVGDVEYPIDQVAEPIFVHCIGREYEIQVQYHKVNNITYVILDAPIFRQQTRANPYHARMDDIESAILYAAWNACIAEAIRRFPVDLYHINDYHGAAAPLYLLPRTIPVALSLHNAEFQGMWPMRTPEESKEVCEVFDLSPEIVKQYVQYGSIFNLLHAGASYIRIHQRGFGAVGVSKKYGDRSLARYPIFWSLDHIGHLPNPDPSDTASWNPEQMDPANPPPIEVDMHSEKKRAEFRQQAQEWAGLEIIQDAQLFVFAGRWSLQKGVDLIADVFPSILEKFPATQLICVGPVIDLYGKFAALKLAKLETMYPGRVYVRAEFTALPECVFAGAEFALIPSRDEPFGLVAVEFGRKGALGVGARVGGLGQMPGFWYTIESTSPMHLLKQFKKAILSALDSNAKTRAQMRAWSLKQRFPVAQWVKRLDSLQAEAIKMHTQEQGKRSRSPGKTLSRVFPGSSIFSPTDSAPPSPRPESPVPRSPLASPGSGFPMAGGSIPNSPRPESPLPLPPGSERHLGTLGALPPGVLDLSSASRRSAAPSFVHSHSRMSTLSVADSFAMRQQNDSDADFGSLELAAPQPFYQQANRNSTQLSLQDVVGDRSDLKLQQPDANFTDANGELFQRFDQLLDDLTPSNSQHELCIANFLRKGEKEWFGRYRNAKLGITVSSTPKGARPTSSRGSSDQEGSPSPNPENNKRVFGAASGPSGADEFQLGEYYKQPKGLKKLLSRRVGDWPVYSLLLAGGQVISANSYQIVLLTGETGQLSSKLYMVAGTYVATSIGWWLMVRNFKSVYALSLPWLFYGFAFLLLGIASFIQSYKGQGTVQDVATVFYAVAASSGALNFSLNFGDESAAPPKQWAIRALVITGASQLYSSALWYWGSLLSNSVHPTGSASGNIGTSPIPKGIVIAIPIALFLWAVGIVLFLGLPDYYRQSPETIPGFYVSLFKRKIVPWFFVMVIIQNYWLSAPYGRSWQFLFSSQHVPAWGVFLMAIFFFIFLWAGVIFGFAHFSGAHPWLIPIFAIGLGAPRWAQTLWGTSGIGMYLPWVGGSGVGGAVLSRCLWLWLGLLDTIQGVGIGMTLLATLTRQHVMGVMIGSQIIGGAITMLARGTSPNAVSPSSTFPDFSQGITPGINQPFFWVALFMELAIPFGFFKFFRKEQVIKP